MSKAWVPPGRMDFARALCAAEEVRAPPETWADVEAIWRATSGLDRRIWRQKALRALELLTTRRGAVK